MDWTDFRFFLSFIFDITLKSTIFSETDIVYKVEFHFFFRLFFILKANRFDQVDFHLEIWNVEAIIIIVMDVNDKLLIFFKVTEGDGFDAVEWHFPPDDVLIFEINQLGKNGLDEVIAFDDVVDGMISEKKDSCLAFIVFIVFLYPT